MTANKKLPNRRSGKGADGPMAQMVDFIQENWKTIVAHDDWEPQALKEF